MIIDGSTSLLLVSMDTVPDEFKTQVDALSLASYSPSEAANQETAEVFDAFIRSDISKGSIRIPIPIDDRLLPIVQTGSDSRMSAQVTKLGFDAPDGGSDRRDVFTPARNTLSLSFRMLSKLGAVSTIADILHALEFMSARAPVYVSWLSATDCIFNARLVGIGRSAERNSDMEQVTLSLERQPNKTDAPAPPDQEELKIDKVIDRPPVPSGANISLYAAAPASAFMDGWLYYEIGKMSDLVEQKVPYLPTPFTVQRQEVEVFLVTSIYKGNQRNLQGVRFRGEMVTLEQNEGAKHVGKLGLVRFANRLYMGVAE